MSQISSVTRCPRSSRSRQLSAAAWRLCPTLRCLPSPPPALLRERSHSRHCPVVRSSPGPRGWFAPYSFTNSFIVIFIDSMGFPGLNSCRLCANSCKMVSDSHQRRTLRESAPAIGRTGRFLLPLGMTKTTWCEGTVLSRSLSIVRIEQTRSRHFPPNWPFVHNVERERENPAGLCTDDGSGGGLLLTRNGDAPCLGSPSSRTLVSRSSVRSVRAW